MRLNQLRRGEGPTLLLIHGLGGSLVNWLPVVDLLAPERDVIAVDLPGFGGSAPLADGRRHSAAAMGREVSAHLAALGIDRPHVAGNSLGAWVALEMAADDAAASVCGISPAGLWRRALGPRSRDVRALARRLRPLVLGAMRTRRGRLALMRTTVARPDLLSGSEAVSWTAAWLDAPAYDDANERMRALVFERAGMVRVPTTIAWGEDDRLLRPPRPERTPAHARLLTKPGWGHTPTRDDPVGVARLLLEASSEPPHRRARGGRRSARPDYAQAMIIQRVENPDFLSNAYLVVDRPGGHGVLVDSNGEHVTEPLVERAEREGTRITHLLVTHHHWDHVLDVEKLAARFDVPVLAHPQAAELLEGEVAQSIEDGDVVESGDLRIEVMHTPGHCADHLALLFDGTDCFTADVLFKGTVGGTRAPGATGFADLRSSIMDRLMKLPPETRIHPGHRGPSTIAAEWEHNPFIRIWRGLDEEAADAVSIGTPDSELREPATLILWAPDYDGGNKAWVRFESGADAIVGGSQVKRDG